MSDKVRCSNMRWATALVVNGHRCLLAAETRGDLVSAGDILDLAGNLPFDTAKIYPVSVELLDAPRGDEATRSGID